VSLANPHFGHVDHAPYAIPNLLRKLGDVAHDEKLTNDRALMVDALAMHATNVETTLLDGIAAVGQVMVDALGSPDDVDKDRLMVLATLIKHLAGDTEFARFVLSDMRHIQRAQLIMTAMPVDKGARK
jgi:hypothetical protein